VRNLGTAAAAAIVAGQPYAGLEDFARRTALPVAALEALAMAGRVRVLRDGQARGAVGGRRRRHDLRAASCRAHPGMTAPPLPAMTAAEETFADLWATGTVRYHPIEHIREMLAERGVAPTSALKTAPDGSAIAVGGLVTHRQQPGTARGWCS